MRKSENINELAAALAKAQGAMKPAQFNKINPHFKSRFADLNSCMEACKQPLAENGLCIMQLPEQIEGKDVLVTMLAHSSGQWITSEYPLLAARMDSQGFGSAMTYAKRYSLCALLGIVADEDDDGEATMDHPSEKKAKTKAEDITKKAKEEESLLPRMTNEHIAELMKLEKSCHPDFLAHSKARQKASYQSEDYKVLPDTHFELLKTAYLQNSAMLNKLNVLEERAI